MSLVSHDDSTAYEATRGSRRPSAAEASQSMLAGHRQLWKLLWLRPDVSSLVTTLLNDLQEKWRYSVVFLLEKIVELQIIYREYQGADLKSSAPFRDGGALLAPQQVMRITQIFSSDFVAHRPENTDDLVNRDLQFKVLAGSLLLLRLHGIFSPSQAKNHQVLQKELYERLKDTLKSRAATRKGNDIAYSLGDDQWFIRYAYSVLSDKSVIGGTEITIFKRISSVFFQGELAHGYDFATALRQLQFFKELPDKATNWDQPLHDLYRFALGAVSLAHHAETVDSQEARQSVATISKEIAKWIVLRIEPLFRNEFSRLQHLRKFQIRAAAIRITTGMRSSELPADDIYGAFGLLHAVNLMAAEFGSLECFNSIKNLSRDLIEQSAGNQDFQPLRLKAMELLLSIKYARSEMTDDFSKMSVVSLHLPYLSGEQTLSARIQRELDVSRAFFISRKRSENNSVPLSVEEIVKRRRNLPSIEDEPISKEPRIYRSSVTSSTPLIDKNSTQSSPMSSTFLQLHEEAVSIQASTAGRPDRKGNVHFIKIPNTKQRHDADPTVTFPMSPVSFSQGRDQPGSLGQKSETHPYSPGSLPRNDSIHELPGDVPYFAKTNRLPLRSEKGSVGSIPISPHPEYSTSSELEWQIQSETSSSPNIFSSSGFRQDSESTATSSGSSSWNLKDLSLDFQVQRIDINPAQKVKFDQNAKRAASVALSPNNECAAFVFSNQIQVCRISTESETPSLGAKVMLTLDKKSDQYIAACLSNTHLVAIASQEIQICTCMPFETSPTSVIVRRLDQEVFPTCIAISTRSDCIALGQRVGVGGPGRATVQNYASIQIYSPELIPKDKLKCQIASDHEFPRNISFFKDDDTFLYSNNRTFGEWTHGIDGWEEVALGTLDARGPGAKGLTSITPISLSPPDASESIANSPIERSRSKSRKFYILTSILSNMADNTSSFVTPLAHYSLSKWKSSAPWCEHLSYSTISSDGRIAAFLTDSGYLRLARLLISDENRTLRLKDLSDSRVKGKKAPRVDGTGKVVIYEDSDGFVVIMVDRYGTVLKTRVTIYVKPQSMPNSSRLRSGSETETIKQPTTSELPGAPAPSQELTALMTSFNQKNVEQKATWSPHVMTPMNLT